MGKHSPSATPLPKGRGHALLPHERRKHPHEESASVHLEVPRIDLTTGKSTDSSTYKYHRARGENPTREKSGKCHGVQIRKENIILRESIKSRYFFLMEGWVLVPVCFSLAVIKPVALIKH